MLEPCFEAIGRKLQSKITENMQAFRQIPQKLKVDPVLQQSQFIEYLLNPLFQLINSPTYQTLSPKLGHKLL